MIYQPAINKVTTFDFNNDGLIDIMAQDTGVPEVYLLINNGDFSFENLVVF